MKTSHSASKNILYSLLLLGIGAALGSALTLYLFVTITGGTAVPSEPISAPTLSLDTLTPPADSATVAPPESSISVPATANESNTLMPQLFRIVSAESEARFSVYETFPEGTAVGRTNQIAGDIFVDFNTPANSQLGTVRINLRTLRTDDPERDSSIRCCVLLTAQQQYEFAEFVPVNLLDLPEQVQIGQPVTFRIIGDLTVRGTTQPVTFDIELNPISESELRGFATTVVNRSSFGILNNSENGFDYHGVVEEVTLEFDFVARAVSP